jgi:nucleoid DNA-binding protein
MARTGEPIQIPAKYVPGFRAGKEFRTLLNGKAHNEELGVS